MQIKYSLTEMPVSYVLPVLYVLLLDFADLSYVY